MGGVVSQGEDNEELVDNLVKAEYITSHQLEQVFRLVDRGDYLLPEFKAQAYKDLAWRHQNLHLSAPCIYAEVLTHLDLQAGHAFLNIGSGTGYLSTVAGLLIGSCGRNHGIELHADVVEYAVERLAEMMRTKPSVDVLDFAMPVFIPGNVFYLHAGHSLGAYDRVYCGAAVAMEDVNFLKSLIKIGGKLVMPNDEQLIKVTRTGLDSWETENLLPVSFATLVMPVKDEGSSQPPPTIILPEIAPHGLMSLCRTVIRSAIRECVMAEQPTLTVSDVVSVTRQGGDGNGSRERRRSNRRRVVRHVIFPLTDDENESDTDNDNDTRINGREALRYLGHVITMGTGPPREEGQEVQADTQTRQISRICGVNYLSYDCLLQENGMSLDDAPALNPPAEGDDDLPQLSSSPVSIAQLNGCSVEAADWAMDHDSSMEYDAQTESASGSNSRARPHSPSQQENAKKFKGVLEEDEESREEGRRADRVAAVAKHNNTIAHFSRIFMSKIHELPLPNNLKDYVNFHRVFKEN